MAKRRPFKSKMRKWMIKHWGMRCLRCGWFPKTKYDIQFLHMDHVVPISIDKSREYDLTNIQPLCQPCNNWKNTKIIDYRI